jgi:hypothetical protein
LVQSNKVEVKMSTMFTAKSADGRAQWRILFDYVVSLTPGDTMTYDALFRLLEVDNRKHVYQIVAITNRQLWSKAQRSLSIVRHVGYRILKAEEHEIQALDLQTQARRRMDSAVSVMRATDLRVLAPDRRDWVLRLTAGLVQVARAIDAHSEQLATHDGLIRDLARRVTDLEDEKNPD